jgi:hypothetical protein
MNIKHFGKWVSSLALMVLALMIAPVQAAEEALGETGTDPRDFAPKFMPYYRYTELENELEENVLTLFGLYAFSPKFAMTYEIPLAMKRDVSDTALRNPDGTCGPGLIPPGEGQPPIPIGAIAGASASDCDEIGVGDMNLRFMYRTDWDALGGDWLVGTQIDFPTASEDVLGSDSLKLGPMFAYVKDLEAYPAPGAFMALMNFYFFDGFRDDSRGHTSLYLGRWFVMLPLRKPGPGLFDGLYALPEFQPIYDFDEEHFSFWAGPEIGKMLSPGNIVYLKPGWGVDPDEAEGDRAFTLEVGWRYFMD